MRTNNIPGLPAPNYPKKLLGGPFWMKKGISRDQLSIKYEPKKKVSNFFQFYYLLRDNYKKNYNSIFFALNNFTTNSSS